MKKQLTLISLSIVPLLAASLSFAHNANYKKDYKQEAMAQPAAAPVPVPVQVLKGGFYVGIAATHDNYNARQNLNFIDSLGDGFTDNPLLAVNGFGGGLFAGYGKYFKSFYLGAEIFGYNRSFSRSHMLAAGSLGSIITYSSQAQVRGNYGISLLPGFKVNDSSLLYIRLGYNRGHLKVQESDIDMADGSTANSSDNEWKGGFNYGVGIETVVYEDFSVRGEYSHTNFNHFTNPGPQTRYSFSDNQFQLGVIYHLF